MYNDVFPRGEVHKIMFKSAKDNMFVFEMRFPEFAEQIRNLFFQLVT